MSASLDLEPSLPLLADPETHLVLFTGATAELAPCEAQVEYIRVVDATGRVDLPGALRELERRYDARLVLCEGGPHLGGELLAAGLLDELWLSLGARIAGDDPAGPARRIVAGRSFEPPLELDLLAVGSGGSDLFLRYGVRSSVTSRATAD